MKFLLLVILIFFLADALHALTMQLLARSWERRQKFVNGVRDGCDAFSMGQGEDAILLIHGFVDNPSVFRQMVPRLAAAGFHCRAMRLPGAAERLKQRGEARLETWQQALDAEIEALGKSHRRIWLLGHSMGGALATEATIRHPEVAGLILLAPLVKVSAALSPLHVPVRIWHRTLWRALLFSQTFKLWLPSEIRRGELVVKLHLDGYFPRSLADNAMELAARMPALAARINGPVFLNVSERDTVVDTPAAIAWFEKSGAGVKDCLVEKDPSHILPLDVGWEARANRIATFIQSH